ncbi:4-amino-4-deoxychorismate lyase [Methylopila jiangsuensis]|uniref:Probable branched-chain-amino-acid aminotransferase n=1 Tax=Methylopila jiangsuensis TaxID=586230 RepID=A0A9W6JIA9_9HYPH|nr:aminotransferase class IV [Methylopila jiangsuensis]MDR6286728.1 branched-chain amino acid aminotransferase [Methylopila jiangsuensis]GLK76926.1 4-amino-4-deoxychorismate lyase [Methylopila jiangsuensis]
MLRLNGQPVADVNRAPFDLADRGLTLGDGLFETIAVFGGRPAALGLHLDRLCAAAAEIRLPVDRAALEREVLALAGEGDGVIRLTVTRGAGARGLAIPDGAEPAVIAARGPYPPNALFAAVRLATVSVRRNPSSFVSRAKTLSYLDSVLAFDAARRTGADDALMLNTAGRVASTAMANLFAVVGGIVVTPSLDEGILPGVTRRLALDACRDLGIPVEERPLGLHEFVSAEAAFAANSVRLAMPVAAVDENVMPGAGHPVVARLSAAVAAACGAPHPR